ncbi:MAG: PDZ domain-containing protein [Actinomycetales bacterium]|nr:PDZ domain-containing protein [Actinomycetales bacterium]
MPNTEHPTSSDIPSPTPSFTGASTPTDEATWPPATAETAALPPLQPIHPVPPQPVPPATFAAPSSRASAPWTAAATSSTPTTTGAPVTPTTSAPVIPPSSATSPPPAQRTPRDRRLWPAVVGTAAATALVASVATAGILQSRETPAQTPAAQASISQVEASDPAPLTGSTSWQEVVDRVADAVVAISVESRFGGSQGSGVIFDASGLVLTNNHVVEGAQQGSIDVVLADGRVIAAEIVGTDETTDLAVLRLTDPPSDLVAATLGDSDSLRVGQGVMAVGNPLGLAGTVTTGIVSALDRPTVTEGSTEAVVTNAIQVDAAVNPGNSGGPLFDAAGRVVGINSSIATLSGGAGSGSIGLGFAIPVNLAKQVAEQLVATGTVSHAFLGVNLADGTAVVDGVERQGAVVGQVVPDSPAQAAGVQDGDVITAIDGKPVASAESLTGYVRARTVGQSSTLTVVRDGAALELTVTLAAREESPRMRG